MTSLLLLYWTYIHGVSAFKKNTIKSPLGEMTKTANKTLTSLMCNALQFSDILYSSREFTAGHRDKVQLPVKSLAVILFP